MWTIRVRFHPHQSFISNLVFLLLLSFSVLYIWQNCQKMKSSMEYGLSRHLSIIKKMDRAAFMFKLITSHFVEWYWNDGKDWWWDAGKEGRTVHFKWTPIPAWVPLLLSGEVSYLAIAGPSGAQRKWYRSVMYQPSSEGLKHSSAPFTSILPLVPNRRTHVSQPARFLPGAAFHETL